MNARQNILNARNKKLFAFRKKYSVLIKTHSALDDSFDRLQNLQNSINENDAITRKDKKALTNEKSLRRNSLCDSAVLVTGALFSLGLDTKNKDLQERFNFTFTNCRKYTEQNFTHTLKQILSEAKHLLTADGYYITQEQLTGFEEEIKAYDKSLKECKDLSEKFIKANHTISYLFKESGELIDKQINKRICRLKLTEPEIYAEYISARTIDDAPVSEGNE